jgi:beta-aspartyl-peptidase (threonine type)
MIIVHGGAGIVTADRIPYLRGGTRAAAMAGDQVLTRGGNALDAVVAAVRLLEQDPEFGAAMGSALTRDGTVETGASVMDGATKRAGAVAAVPDCAAPVILARRVLEMGEHVVLAGAAAQTLANEIGFPPAPPGSLITPRTQQQLAAAKVGQRTLEGGGVGAVARDSKGNFAAATSTGGIVFRRAGSIDDSAIPGVGTWADDICAISTSGGESLFRVALAHNIAMRIHAGAGPRKAVEKALGDLRDLAKDQIAGAIVLDKNSWVALQIGPSAPIPTTMPCGWVDTAGANDAPGFPL